MVKVIHAIFVEPFHHDSKYTGKIEFHNIGVLFFVNFKAKEYRTEDVCEHFFVHLAKIHSVKLFYGSFEYTLIFLYKREVWGKIFGRDKDQLAFFTALIVQRDF